MYTATFANRLSIHRSRFPPSWHRRSRQAGSVIATLVDPLVDLVLPRHCAGCDRPGSGWCVSCRDCVDLRGTSLAGLPVVAAAEYAGPVRRGVLAYKERGRRDLARPLGRVLAVAVRALLLSVGLRPGAALLVCVPSTRAAATRRGGDHVARLAIRAAPTCGVPVARGLLRVRDDVLDSAGLGAADRVSNLSGAMRAAPPAGGTRARSARRLILVDDIVSSGSTMLEAARALATAGWPVAGAVALAATPPAGSGAAVTWDRQLVRQPLAVPR